MQPRGAGRGSCLGQGQKHLRAGPEHGRGGEAGLSRAKEHSQPALPPPPREQGWAIPAWTVALAVRPACDTACKSHRAVLSFCDLF